MYGGGSGLTLKCQDATSSLPFERTALHLLSWFLPKSQLPQSVHSSIDQSPTKPKKPECGNNRERFIYKASLWIKERREEKCCCCLYTHILLWRSRDITISSNYIFMVIPIHLTSIASTSEYIVFVIQPLFSCVWIWNCQNLMSIFFPSLSLRQHRDQAS